MREKIIQTVRSFKNKTRDEGVWLLSCILLWALGIVLCVIIINHLYGRELMR